MATNDNSPSNPRVEKMGAMLDVLSIGFTKTAASESEPELQRLIPVVPVEPARQLLSDKMLADRWVC
jgi:hypothetical protein